MKGLHTYLPILLLMIVQLFLTQHETKSQVISDFVDISVNVDRHGKNRIYFEDHELLPYQFDRTYTIVWPNFDPLNSRYFQLNISLFPELNCRSFTLRDEDSDFVPIPTESILKRKSIMVNQLVFHIDYYSDQLCSQGVNSIEFGAQIILDTLINQQMHLDFAAICKSKTSQESLEKYVEHNLMCTFRHVLIEHESLKINKTASFPKKFFRRELRRYERNIKESYLSDIRQSQKSKSSNTDISNRYTCEDRGKLIRLIQSNKLNKAARILAKTQTHLAQKEVENFKTTLLDFRFSQDYYHHLQFRLFKDEIGEDNYLNMLNEKEFPNPLDTLETLFALLDYQLPGDFPKIESGDKFFYYSTKYSEYYSYFLAMAAAKELNIPKTNYVDFRKIRTDNDHEMLLIITRDSASQQQVFVKSWEYSLENNWSSKTYTIPFDRVLPLENSEEDICNAIGSTITLFLDDSLYVADLRSYPVKITPYSAYPEFDEKYWLIGIGDDLGLTQMNSEISRWFWNQNVPLSEEEFKYYNNNRHVLDQSKILYNVELSHDDINGDEIPEVFRYSICNGKPVDIFCLTLINGTLTEISDEIAQEWLSDEFLFGNLLLVSQLEHSKKN